MHKNTVKGMLLGISMLACSMGIKADYPMAGINPSQRPQGAPVITHISHNDAWYQQALRGIEKPYPGSLRFLENQGNWHTPFNQPGLKGPYDIRNWHQ